MCMSISTIVSALWSWKWWQWPSPAPRPALPAPCPRPAGQTKHFKVMPYNSSKRYNRTTCIYRACERWFIIFFNDRFAGAWWRSRRSRAVTSPPVIDVFYPTTAKPRWGLWFYVCSVVTETGFGETGSAGIYLPAEPVSTTRHSCIWPNWQWSMSN